MNYNSSINQDIKRKFVDREVYANVSSVISRLIEFDENGEFQEELENYFVYGTADRLYTEEAREEKLEELDERISEIESESDLWYELCDEYDELRDAELVPQEVFEWYVVSRALYKALRGKGEVVWQAGSCFVWARGGTGQAIMLDSVISEICEEMGILEGQEHDWSKAV